MKSLREYINPGVVIVIAICRLYYSFYNSIKQFQVYSADEYGELGADAFTKEARKVNICIAIEERIPMKLESLRESIDNLIKKLV